MERSCERQVFHPHQQTPCPNAVKSAAILMEFVAHIPADSRPNVLPVIVAEAGPDPVSISVKNGCASTPAVNKSR